MLAQANEVRRAWDRTNHAYAHLDMDASSDAHEHLEAMVGGYVNTHGVSTDEVHDIMGAIWETAIDSTSGHDVLALIDRIIIEIRSH